MKTIPHRLRRGLTLVELSIAILLGMAVGSMTLALFNQQLTFLKLYKAQSFLADEAPIISMYVSRLVGKADRFRLHDSVADALSGTNPRLTRAAPNLPLPPVVVLNFRQPDGTMRATILSFENRGTGLALYYYVVPVTGPLGEPQWAVTKTPKNVTFEIVQGVLRMTLTGPADEQITYSGTMLQ
jgi:hypothetical protein